MYSLEAPTDHRANSKQSRSLRCPITRAARAVLLTGKHYQRHTLGQIFHRRVVNAHLLAVGVMHRHAALCSGDHEVLDPHIGKRPASHHPIVSSTRAVAVEVRNRNASLLKITAGWRIGLDRTG